MKKLFKERDSSLCVQPSFYIEVCSLRKWFRSDPPGSRTCTCSGFVIEVLLSQSGKSRLEKRKRSSLTLGAQLCLGAQREIFQSKLKELLVSGKNLPQPEDACMVRFKGIWKGPYTHFCRNQLHTPAAITLSTKACQAWHMKTPDTQFNLNHSDNACIFFSLSMSQASCVYGFGNCYLQVLFLYFHSAMFCD